MKFKVGDIVYFSSGRICNGVFGEIRESPENNGILCVMDNEGAPDMDVSGHEQDLFIVGNMQEDSKLLDVFADTPEEPIFLYQILKKVDSDLERIYAGISTDKKIKYVETGERLRMLLITHLLMTIKSRRMS